MKNTNFLCRYRAISQWHGFSCPPPPLTLLVWCDLAIDNVCLVFGNIIKRRMTLCGHSQWGSDWHINFARPGSAPIYGAKKKGEFRNWTKGVGKLIASLDFMLRVLLIQRDSSLVNSKEKIADSCRIGWKFEGIRNHFVLSLDIQRILHGRLEIRIWSSGAECISREWAQRMFCLLHSVSCRGFLATVTFNNE